MPRRSAWRSKLALLSAFVLAGAVLCELAARAYWSIGYGVPFRDPGRVLYAYYPDLALVDALAPLRDDGHLDILLLGGSALHSDFATVDRELDERLAAAGHRSVRIFNLAQPAQTSRDSWIKYASMDRARFDLVIFYHGINDARANNAPPELYREDYGHYSWYEIVNDMAPHHGSSSLALPQTLRFLRLRLRQRLDSDRYVPTHLPRPDWIAHGNTYRSRESFERNLRGIVKLAAQRGDPLLLVTFAAYFPEDYSDEAFAAQRLDYSLHLFGVHHWGALENVAGAIDAHNQVVRRVAEQEDLPLLDQAKLMQGSSRSFNDPCHLTTHGSREFVDHLLEVMLPMLDGDA